MGLSTLHVTIKFFGHLNASGLLGSGPPESSSNT
jgi:hypothetical protein